MGSFTIMKDESDQKQLVYSTDMFEHDSFGYVAQVCVTIPYRKGQQIQSARRTLKRLKFKIDDLKIQQF
tara:strand:+ start:62 stop:268 length:207 start_codon:yes stop_codon:yes gene_type:complete